MQQSEWLYKPSKEISNLSDLELEKQRLRLHQKFLGELLQRDKALLKASVNPKNLMNAALFNVFDSSEGQDESGGVVQGVISKTPYGKIFNIIRWIFKKLIK